MRETFKARPVSLSLPLLTRNDNCQLHTHIHIYTPILYAPSICLSRFELAPLISTLNANQPDGREIRHSQSEKENEPWGPWRLFVVIFLRFSLPLSFVSLTCRVSCLISFRLIYYCNFALFQFFFTSFFLRFC